MSQFRIEGVSTSVAERIRERRADDHGNEDLRPIHVDASPGYICRHCLRDPEVGDSVYLLSYSPFESPRPYRNVGPIFLHTTPCERYAHSGEIPDSLRHRLLSVRAYRADDHLVTSDVIPGQDLAPLMDRFFLLEEVEYLDIHNARPGCFNCRVRRI